MYFLRPVGKFDLGMHDSHLSDQRVTSRERLALLCIPCTWVPDQLLHRIVNYVLIPGQIIWTREDAVAKLASGRVYALALMRACLWIAGFAAARWPAFIWWQHLAISGDCLAEIDALLQESLTGECTVLRGRPRCLFPLAWDPFRVLLPDGACSSNRAGARFLVGDQCWLLSCTAVSSSYDSTGDILVSTSFPWLLPYLFSRLLFRAFSSSFSSALATLAFSSSIIASNWWL